MLAGKWIASLVFLVMSVTLAFSQEGERPFLRDENLFGRPDDAFSLRFCVDSRDPSWELDKAIGEAIADALLLEAKPFIIESQSIASDEAELYRHLLVNCRIYFGFKLIAQGYPDWLTVTRPLYDGGYIFLAQEPAPKRLADIPSRGRIATTLGTSADLRLIQFNNSRPSAERWKRIPYTSDEAAVNAVLADNADVALVWAPTFARLSKTNTEYQRLKVVDPTPLTLPAMPVGALLLAQDTHLRVNVDRAITDLIADGTVDDLLKKYGMRWQ
jgi:polar amino acid transport system substrate-binding protein